MEPEVSNLTTPQFDHLREMQAMLSALKPGDRDGLVPIGAGMEDLVTQLSPELLPHEDLMFLALKALQALYEQGEATPPEVIASLIELFGACADLCESASPERVRAIRAAGSNLRDAIGAGDPEIAADTSTKIRPTIDDVAAQVVITDPADPDAVAELRETLEAASLADKLPDTVKRSLAEASTRIAEAVQADDDSLAEALAHAAAMIENLIQQRETDDDEKNPAASEDPRPTPAAAADDTAQPARGEIDLDSVETESPIGGSPVAAAPSAAAPAALEPVAVEAAASVVEETASSSASQPLPPDTDPDLLREFIMECRELLTNAEAALLVLEANPDDHEAINTVFRAIHTIKGTSGFLGLETLGTLSHQSEGLLSRIREGQIHCTGRYADLALRSVDLLKGMVDGVESALHTGMMLMPDGIDELLAGLNRPDEAPAAQSASAPAATVEPESVSGSADSASAADPVAGAGPVAAAEAVAPMAPALALTQERPQPIKQAPQEAGTVRVRTDRLDKLIEMVGELVIAQSMVAQDPEVLSGHNHSLGRKVGHAGKILRELQDLSMSMRMVPLKSTFQKMARLVRDLAQSSGKRVQFAAVGDDTEIDRNMVDVLNDPLIHLVRNAMDHGLEGPDEREAAGKPGTGTISISAYRAGENVVVEVRDDGRGLNRENIVTKAVNKGLIESGKGMSDAEVFELIFAPGFSTAERVTQVSGRGVGMDVVRKNVQALRGKVEITSEPGAGSTFHLRLPLTLAITDGMLVRIGDQQYIVPTVNIQLCFRPDAASLATVQGRGELALLRGDPMPIFRLHRLYGIPNAVQDPTRGLLIVIGSGERQCALLVDELLGQQQVVAKALGDRLGRVPGISGGAILGNGCVGLIIDTNEIIALARQTACGGDSTFAASEAA